VKYRRACHQGPGFYRDGSHHAKSRPLIRRNVLRPCPHAMLRRPPIVTSSHLFAQYTCGGEVRTKPQDLLIHVLASMSRLVAGEVVDKFTKHLENTVYPTYGRWLVRDRSGIAHLDCCLLLFLYTMLSNNYCALLVSHNYNRGLLMCISILLY
jgi:hypothetical protein